MSNKPFTRRCHANRPSRFIWFVLVGEECAEHFVEMATPCEQHVRRLLGLSQEVPVEIGRP